MSKVLAFWRYARELSAEEFAQLDAEGLAVMATPSARRIGGSWGYARAASGERYPFHTHIAEGRLGNKRGRIDLYLWIDDNRKRRRIGGFLWCDTNVEHTAALRTLLRNIVPEDRAA